MSYSELEEALEEHIQDNPREEVVASSHQHVGLELGEAVEAHIQEQSLGEVVPETHQHLVPQLEEALDENVQQHTRDEVVATRHEHLKEGGFRTFSWRDKPFHRFVNCFLDVIDDSETLLLRGAESERRIRSHMDFLGETGVPSAEAYQSFFEAAYSLCLYYDAAHILWYQSPVRARLMTMISRVAHMMSYYLSHMLSVEGKPQTELYFHTHLKNAEPGTQFGNMKHTINTKAQRTVGTFSQGLVEVFRSLSAEGSEEQIKQKMEEFLTKHNIFAWEKPQKDPKNHPVPGVMSFLTPLVTMTSASRNEALRFFSLGSPTPSTPFTISLPDEKQQLNFIKDLLHQGKLGEEFRNCSDNIHDLIYAYHKKILVRGGNVGPDRYNLLTFATFKREATFTSEKADSVAKFLAERQRTYKQDYGDFLTSSVQTMQWLEMNARYEDVDEPHDVNFDSIDTKDDAQKKFLAVERLTTEYFVELRWANIHQI